ncbi:MAG: ImmA/IrrE family metallo-endopeptidase [Pseudomonadota bacterium]
MRFWSKVDNSLKLPNGSPVVALTLWYDRLDNFWFSLFHELANVALHLDKDDVEAFFDDLTACERKDEYESEADKLASESLIPENEWKSVRLSTKSLAKTVMAFAEKLRISPAIPAGRIRFEPVKDQLPPVITVYNPACGSGGMLTEACEFL